ncbi:hypothetical protein Micbo1qcDRAFT_170577 [Microdochium bolleyi]|uniref:Uncharacterized protein n=1 Tax=Microdochium bolleyi TaxID=196109 RepID=A0A136JI29_9PEZI|nr:hypothetical protein Micbo1qcDRAFT_170577 [Microdochium bolleyi]
MAASFTMTLGLTKLHRPEAPKPGPEPPPPHWAAEARGCLPCHRGIQNPHTLAVLKQRMPESLTKRCLSRLCGPRASKAAPKGSILLGVGPTLPHGYVVIGVRPQPTLQLHAFSNLPCLAPIPELVAPGRTARTLLIVCAGADEDCLCRPVDPAAVCSGLPPTVESRQGARHHTTIQQAQGATVEDPESWQRSASGVLSAPARALAARRRPIGWEPADRAVQTSARALVLCARTPAPAYPERAKPFARQGSWQS